jgi:hypothetical protein
MREKRQELSDYIQGIATANGITLNIEFRPREKFIDMDSPKERNKVMGNPVRYVRIAHVGSPNGSDYPQSTNGRTTINNADRAAVHEFRVFLYYEYQDNDSYNRSSQKEFEDLIEGSNGILPNLREAQGFQKDGVYAFSSRPFNIVIPSLPRPLGNSERVYSHYLEFTINIT